MTVEPGRRRPSNRWPTTWSRSATGPASSWSTRPPGSAWSPRPGRSRSRRRTGRRSNGRRGLPALQRPGLPPSRRSRCARRRRTTTRRWSSTSFGRDSAADHGASGRAAVGLRPRRPERGAPGHRRASPRPGVRVRIAGSRVTVAKGEQPLVIPFRVEDADGGAATAQLYVPALGTGLPYVRANALIRLDPGESVEARALRLRGQPRRRAARASPRRAARPARPLGSVDAGDHRTVHVHRARGAGLHRSGGGDVRGHRHRATRTLPARSGSCSRCRCRWATPRRSLTCPTDPITVPQGGRVDSTSRALCNVLHHRSRRASLRYTADWGRSVDGLSIVAGRGHAHRGGGRPGDARPGSEARAAGAGRGQRARPAPDPGRRRGRARPSRRSRSTVCGPVRARTVDLARYLTPGVRNPVPTVVGRDRHRWSRRHRRARSVAPRSGSPQGQRSTAPRSSGS